MTKKVDLKDYAKVLKDHANLTLAAQRKAVISGLQKSIPYLVEESPVDTGLYAQSWDMHVDEVQAVLGNYAPYAGVIEWGARPHKPPIGPLLRWAKRVLGDSSQPNSKESYTGVGGEGFSPQVWALAIGVQKKIMERGQAPKHILENALPQIIRNIKEELKKI